MATAPSTTPVTRGRAAQRALTALLAVVVLSLLPLATAAAASYQEMLADTDTDNVHEVYELAMWCQENRYFPQARQHLKRVIELEPDHQGARQARGEIFHDGEWKHFSMVPGGRAAIEAGTQGAEQADGNRGGRTARAAGPAPSADEIEWDLTLPPVPEEDEPIVDYLVTRIAAEMPGLDNWSGRMEQNYRTFLLDQYRPHAVQAWARALADEDFDDVFGVVSYLQELMRQDRGQAMLEAERLMPFMVTASTRVDDGEELYYFASIVGAVGERRAVPRLIELLGEGGDAAEGAKLALHDITLMAQDEITQASAQQWWERNHAVTPGELYGEMLEDDDPMKRLQACRKLYNTQDQRIIPTLIEILGSDNRAAVVGAASMLRRVAGSDWDLGDLDLSPEQRRSNLARLEAWWDENENTFVFLEFRQALNEAAGQPAVRTDPVPGWINQLGSVQAQEVTAAREGLLARGEAAIPALIDALGNNQGVIRSEARDLLREITGQNFGFRPIRGTPEERNAAQEQWREWARAEGHLDGE